MRRLFVHGFVIAILLAFAASFAANHPELKLVFHSATFPAKLG